MDRKGQVDLERKKAKIKAVALADDQKTCTVTYRYTLGYFHDPPQRQNIGDIIRFFWYMRLYVSARVS